MKKQFKKIYIEITNVCNLNCDFCPQTNRPHKFMSLSVFKKALEESKPLCEEITLHIMGEHLIHPQIEEFILLAEEMNIKINLTTNGTMTKKHSQLLLNNSIRRINFSIHGIKNNFSLDNQNKYLQEIINFTKLAQEKREDLIIIYRLWNINNNNNNNNSNNKLIEKIESEFDVKLEEKDKRISTKIKNNSFIHYDKSFEWPSLKNPIRSKTGYCHGLSTHIGILVDGTIVPCCLDNEGTIPLGNINKSPLKNILSSTRATNMKKGFKERKLVEELCTKCTFIERFDKNKRQ